MEHSLSKAEKFLIIVQTSVLSNSINLASNSDWAEQYRDVISSTGIRSIMNDAIRVSSKIPKSMHVTDAADEFCNFILRNERDDIEKGGKKLIRPHWITIYSSHDI